MFGHAFPDFPQYSPSGGQSSPVVAPPPPPQGLVVPPGVAHSTDERVMYELIAEKELVDPSLRRIHSLVDAEIAREGGKREPEYVELDGSKPVRITKKVLIPVQKHPGFNFVGKLMGPGGKTLKSMQEKLGVKLSVMGRGSMRVQSQEEDCLASGDPKYAHLKERLHIRINVNGTPWEAYRKIGDALEELKPYLTPDSNDEIVQQQTNELGFNPQNRGGGKSRRGNMPPRGGRTVPYDPSGPYIGTPPVRGRGRGRGPHNLGPMGISNGRGYVDGIGMAPNAGMRGPAPHFGGPQGFNQMPRGGYARGSPYDMRGRYPVR